MERNKPHHRTAVKRMNTCSAQKQRGVHMQAKHCVGYTLSSAFSEVSTYVKRKPVWNGK